MAIAKATRAQPAALTVVRRARDMVVAALSKTSIPSMAELVALAELSDECRARGGGSEPDALTQLLFRTRQAQAERERRIAQVRRRLGA
jgi:hypothetical protein